MARRALFAMLAGALAFIFSAQLWGATPPAMLRTLDGKTYEGDLHFDADGQSLLMTSRSGTTTHVDLANVLEADFRVPPPALATQPIASVFIDGPLPQPRPGQDLGIANGSNSWSRKGALTIKIGATPVPDNGKNLPNAHM